MAHVLVVERDPTLGGEHRSPSIQGALERAGHKVTALQSTAEVIPYLREAGGCIDAVALSMLQREPSTWSFDVAKEMCRTPGLQELGKILAFPLMATRQEMEQMYGEKGYATFGPQLPRTIAVNESNLLALDAALSVLRREL